MTRLGSTTSDGMLGAGDGARSTGFFSSAAVVEGLMSCVGDGSRFTDAVWIVSAIPRAGLSMLDGNGMTLLRSKRNRKF